MADNHNDFSAHVLEKRHSLASDFWNFLRDNKKWWLLPIVVVFLLVGGLLIVGGTAAAPFIYTLF